MLYKCYLRNDVVYVPTVGRRGGGAYTIMDPVSVIPATKIEDVRRALLDAIDRGNVTVPLLKGKRPPFLLLKYTGLKSWSAFARSASSWNITDEKGIHQIIGHRMHPDGYWVEDQNHKIEFPPGTTLDAVIDRIIAILQEAARNNA
jgi:hypothetical protein